MNRLREARTKCKYSLRDLEDVSGIARSTLSDIENSKRQMGVTHAEKLSPILGVSIDFLMGTDAIKIVDSFEDALENLFLMSVDSFYDAADNEKLSNRQRLVFNIIDQLLHRTLSDKDLDLIADMVVQLGNKNSPSNDK